MKIIAQSAVPSQMPYLHLGYGAATITKPDGALMGTGGVLVLIAIALATTLLVGKIAARWPALSYVRRRAKLILGVVALLLVLGVVVLAYGFRK